QGQRSIQAVSEQRVSGVALTVVRPWLDRWREEIDQYVATNRVRFREDASNLSVQPTRNRIRHRIIPMIEKEFGRGVRQNLWRAAAIAAEEHAALEAMMPAELEDAMRLSVLAVQRLPVALQRRALRDWLRQHAVSEVGFDLIESLRALLDSSGGVAKVNLPGDRHARRRAGELFLE
ncbi:MAG TPA: ATP-binding protein, partial [Chthoniobacterales bacterium]|nr:ATP-binding protein [Chthoniobacterales bacterium]